MLTTQPIWVQTVAPASEPVTAAEAKAQINISGSDHDTQLALLIEKARIEYESDVDTVFIQRTGTWTMESLAEMQFPARPVNSISSIKYYDLANAQQTLSTAVYQLDSARQHLRLAYNQDWPSTLDRWDCVEITVVLGDHSAESTVPALAKQAMLLLIARDWYDRPDITSKTMMAYESLVKKFMRSTYP